MDIDFNVAYGRPSPIAGLAQGIDKGMEYGMAINELRLKKQKLKQEEESKQFEMITKGLHGWSVLKGAPTARKEYWVKKMIPLGEKMGLDFPVNPTAEVDALLDEAVNLTDNLSKIKNPTPFDLEVVKNGLRSIGVKLKALGEQETSDDLLGLSKTIDSEKTAEEKMAELKTKKGETAMSKIYAQAIDNARQVVDKEFPFGVMDDEDFQKRQKRLEEQFEIEMQHLLSGPRKITNTSPTPTPTKVRLISERNK